MSCGDSAPAAAVCALPPHHDQRGARAVWVGQWTSNTMCSLCVCQTSARVNVGPGLKNASFRGPRLGGPVYKLRSDCRDNAAALRSGDVED
ncbi:unnamed protein product [Merluccius merluccius]